MFIDPVVHERFVQDFGLNMLNTLTAQDHRQVAHKRRIHVFDERGGVFGGSAATIQEYQNLTTGVFHSKTRNVVGVKYRCIPNDLDRPVMGAFHTHPALYDDDVAKVRRRIDQLLWLSEMDKVAFFKQHEMYGYEWHFIGCVDIACFNIHDLKRDVPYPRYVLRYPRLEQLMEQLRPEILHYDRILGTACDAPRTLRRGTLHEIVCNLTQQDGRVEDILEKHDHEAARQLGRRVAQECQLRGLTASQVSQLLGKSIAPSPLLASHGGPAPIDSFRSQVMNTYDRLAQLV